MTFQINAQVTCLNTKLQLSFAIAKKLSFKAFDTVEIENAENEAKTEAKEARKNAWNAFIASMKDDHTEAKRLLSELANQSSQKTV